MTWFIDTNNFERAATVDSYVGGRLPEIVPTKSRQPLSEQQVANLPQSIKVFPRSVGYEHHVFFEIAGYVFLSAPAFDVLRQYQSEGWEAFPIKVASTNADETLVGDTYFLVNLFLHKSIVDIQTSDIPAQVINAGTIVEKIVYWLDSKHRKIAVKRDLISGACLWLGSGNVLSKVIFVADSLKEAWCRLGMNPAIFEPCVEV